MLDPPVKIKELWLVVPHQFTGSQQPIFQEFFTWIRLGSQIKMILGLWLGWPIKAVSWDFLRNVTSEFLAM